MSESKPVQHRGASTYASNIMKFIESRTTDLGKMSRRGKFFIKPGAQIPPRRSRFDVTVINSNVIDLNFTSLLSSPNYNKFSFAIVQRKFIRTHPVFYIFNTPFHCNNCRIFDQLNS